MNPELQNRRRNYYIKKQFQSRFILKFCALVVIGSVISGVIIYVMSMAAVTTTFEHSRLTIKSTADYILPAVLLSGIIVIISIGIATIIMTLFTSHKIAGPLYRMEKDVEDLAAGNLKKRFNLRQGDELKPLAAGLDAMAQTLRIRVEKIKLDLAALDKAMASGGGAAKDKLDILKSSVDKFST